MEPPLDSFLCEGCRNPLKPGAKFCAECGASTAPKVEKPEVEDVKVCGSCGTPVEANARFCPDCGAKQVAEPAAQPERKVKVPVKKESKATKKTVVLPSKEEPEPDEELEKPEDEFDFSQIDPEKDWECFGQIEPDNFECKKCAYRDRCAEKAGIEI